MDGEDQPQQPAGKLKAAIGERDDETEPITGSIVASRWRRLAAELHQAAEAVTAGDMSYQQASARIGHLAAREAVAQGVVDAEACDI